MAQKTVSACSSNILVYRYMVRVSKGNPKPELTFTNADHANNNYMYNRIS